MQSLFKTNAVHNPNVKNTNEVDINDFSTMQNMFATVNPNQMPTNISQMKEI